MKIRRSLALGVGLAVLAPFAIPGAGAETPEVVAIAKADAWLRTQQQADGGFEVSGFPGFETPDATLALAAVGEGAWDAASSLAYVQAAEKAGKDPLDAIDDLIDGDTATDPTSNAAGARAAKILTLVTQPLALDGADFDPSGDTAEDVDLLARMDEHRNPDGSYDFGPQFNGVLFTALALAGEGEAVPAALVTQIRAAQRSDGSWDYTGTTTGDGEDIDTTSTALIALHEAGVPATDADLVAGVKFLAQRHQASNGSWQAFGFDDANATAVATIALSDLGLDVSTAGWRTAVGVSTSGTYTSPLAWFLAQQASDGHFGGDYNTFGTSQSMQAIGKQWFLSTERAQLVDAWSRDLGSPANAEASGRAGDGDAALGSNPSLRSKRLAGATAVVTGQAGREAAANDLFQAAFGRNLDPSGRAYWSGKLKTLSRPEVLARLTGSSEYYRKAGGTIPTFVDKVYLSVLGRPADPSGRAYWIRQLQNGRSVQSVARSLTVSSEYRRIQVRTAFTRVLDRQPSAGELSYWTTKVATTRVEVLLATIGSSAEHYGALGS